MIHERDGQTADGRTDGRTDRHCMTAKTALASHRAVKMPITQGRSTLYNDGVIQPITYSIMYEIGCTEMDTYRIGPCTGTEDNMYRNGSRYVPNWTLYRNGSFVPKTKCTKETVPK